MPSRTTLGIRAGLALLTTAALALGTTGCLAGENASAAPAAPGDTAWSSDTLTVDFATYNPLSLIIREQGLIEEALGDSVTVEWVQSAGSNKANEFLRAGSIDFGSWPARTVRPSR